VAADGTNVVLAAAQGGSASALELALDLAPDVNVANANGQTALHLLVGGGVRPEMAAMMRILAAHGARADIKTKYRVTAAEVADGGLTEVRAIFRQFFPATVTLAEAAGKPAAPPDVKN